MTPIGCREGCASVDSCLGHDTASMTELDMDEDDGPDEPEGGGTGWGDEARAPNHDYIRNYVSGHVWTAPTDVAEAEGIEDLEFVGSEAEDGYDLSREFSQLIADHAEGVGTQRDAVLRYYHDGPDLDRLEQSMEKMTQEQHVI